MEARTGSGWDEAKWESARRCLLAAERSTDKRERRALGRAGLKFLCGALGMECVRPAEGQPTGLTLRGANYAAR